VNSVVNDMTEFELHMIRPIACKAAFHFLTITKQITKHRERREDL